MNLGEYPSRARPAGLGIVQKMGILLLLVAACFLAPTVQSLWIDEAQTALIATPATLQGWWHALYHQQNSNLQMPLYMFYIWGWARCFGLSEIALRLANLPCFLGGFLAIGYFLRRHPGLRAASLLLYSIHPFVWFYINEARPYIMQLCGALIVCGCLLTALDATNSTDADQYSGEDEVPAGPASGPWWWLLCIGLLLLCGSTILGIPWAAAIVPVLLAQPSARRGALTAGRVPLLTFLPLYVALAVYFGWTIWARVGTGYFPRSLATTPSFVYEQAGFLGLGPARNDLRVASIAVVLPYLLPLAMFAALLAYAMIPAIIRRFGLSPRRFRMVLMLAGLPTILILMIGYARHARIVGRHLAPLFPFVLGAEAVALLMLWRHQCPGAARLGRVVAIVFVAVLVLSSLELRFDSRHSKDDYRSAVACAADALAQHKLIWWSASQDPAAYYGLPLLGMRDPAGYEHLPADSATPLFAYSCIPEADVSFTGPMLSPAALAPPATLRPADVIVYSKPDLSDDKGELARFIALHHYRLVARYPAFTVWER